MTGAKPAIAVVGAGLIGPRHAAALARSERAVLHSIADPADAGKALAARHGVPHFGSLEELLDKGRPDGVIVATPSQMHVEHGLACVAAGVPALIEKPLGTDLEGCRKLVEAGISAGVPLLVGHHRRHNPLVAKAKQLIGEGALGRIVSVHAMFWLVKPDAYFEPEWRRRPGAGPIYTNLVHDIDLLRYLAGEIVEVRCTVSNAIRGHDVEESAVMTFRFADGALGTANVSDAIPAPWSWEMTAGENPDYPDTGQGCYWIGGTQASLELPGVKLWSHTTKRSWWEPIGATAFPMVKAEPLVRQADQFAAVIAGEEEPLVPAIEGLRSLEVIDALFRSAGTGGPVSL